MSRFKKILDLKEGSKVIMQGNEAFALGVVHAGYHAADGYPGTPSTEVIDKSLKYVQDRIKVGWSVNEAVAVGVAVGHSVAGFDAVVTMKIPGVFQAGDVITTSAFYTAPAGALVIYAATDLVPSSTQHVIDARYFFASSRIPVFEPRNHQEMYEMPFIAADVSRKFHTPVVVLANGILAHSEGLVTLRAPRKITPRELPENLHQWMLMPSIARQNYNKATQERIPQIEKWLSESNLINYLEGKDDFGVIVSGESNIILKEVLSILNLSPHILSLAVTYPFPEKEVIEFSQKLNGKKIFVIEDGDRFVEEKVRLLGVNAIGKEKYSVITDWTPEMLINYFCQHLNININYQKASIPIEPLNRPPSICPGCPYRAFGITVSNLKKQKKIYASFGDIGCSTLLYFLNSLDTVLCMGGSESMRQGFVLSRPDMANKVISVIGDSCECHTGLDATRNAIFRQIPGIKVILDNKITAMTGGQPAPSSVYNLEGKKNTFSLRRAVEAEGGKTVVVDSYNLKEVENSLKNALLDAENGIFTTLILEGNCIQETEFKKKIPILKHDYEKCKRCRRCDICPGIEFDEDGKPVFTSLCTNCGSNMQICLQRCPFGAIIPSEETKEKIQPPKINFPINIDKPDIERKNLPESIRVAIRGIGGQGNLFFGKVLSEVALRTPYSNESIIKGDTHGMAQLGGPVISTFACGKVYSPIMAPQTADVIVVMETSEILRPGFIDLLKKDGTIIFNNFSVLPVNTKKEQYPRKESIMQIIKEYKIIEINALEEAKKIGDITGKTSNVIVLGLLSTIHPFDLIPYEIWIDALMFVSPDEITKSANYLAFNAGRELKK